jgi:glycosyltransferase involved in cell wall biosynthesis
LYQLQQEATLSLSLETSHPGQHPAASFVIPTYNRVDVLQICLAHLELQTCRDFEVVLIDDGSTDSTPHFLAHYALRAPFPIRCLHQQNAGPARARNQGIRVARAPISLIIGDDIFCAPDFLAAHLAFHRQYPQVNYAGLGLTQWSETGQTVTPFMRWMDLSGAQFAYGDLLRGDTPDWRYFYTSNLSVKTDLLRRHPFNEQFPAASMEDMELGYRLEREEDLHLVFLPDALADHLHPTDFRKACLRAYGTGLSLNVFDRLWPQRAAATHGKVHLAVRSFLCSNPWLLEPITSATEALTRAWCPNPFIKWTLAYHTALARQRHR